MIATLFFFFHLTAMGLMLWAFLRAIAPLCRAPRAPVRGDAYPDPLDHKATPLEGFNR